MASSPFGFGPPASLPRRSVIDPITGLPVVTSAPTGETVRRSTVLPVGYDAEGRAHLAAPAPLAAMQDALNFVGDVAAGRKGVFDPATGRVSDEAVGKGLDLAGLAMTGGFAAAAPRRISQAFAGAGRTSLGPVEARPDAVASRSGSMYDPIPRPARPFEADYPVGRWPDGPPADASGRLTRDIEGRPLNLDAFVVGRGAVGRPDRPLPQAELDAVTAALLGDHAQGVAPSALGRRAVGKFVAGHDPATGHVSDEAVGKGLDLAGLAMTDGFAAAAPRRISQAFADNGGFLPSAAPRDVGTVASRAPPMYDLVSRPARPFKADYPLARWPDGPPADASGRLTRDIEGRPLHPGARVVGRGAVDGPDRALSGAELDALTARILGESYQIVPPQALPRRSIGAFERNDGPDGIERRILLRACLT